MGLLTTPEHTITTIMLYVCHPKMLHKHCLQFLLGVKIAPKETENNAHAKFWGDKQRTLCLICYGIFWSGQFHLISTVQYRSYSWENHFEEIS